MAATTKPAVQSAQMWVNIIMAVVAFFPPVQALVTANPEISMLLVTGINAVLRYFKTNTGLSGVF